MKEYQHYNNLCQSIAHAHRWNVIDQTKIRNTRLNKSTHMAKQNLSAIRSPDQNKNRFRVLRGIWPWESSLTSREAPYNRGDIMVRLLTGPNDIRPYRQIYE